jgi:hypothetical protein
MDAPQLDIAMHDVETRNVHIHLCVLCVAFPIQVLGMICLYL